MADDLGKIRASLMLREGGDDAQVELRTTIPKALRKRLKRKFGKLKLVVLGTGEDSTAVEVVAVHKLKLRRKVRKWYLDQAELCSRGLRRLRFEITPSVKAANQHAENVTTLDLPCAASLTAPSPR